MVLVVGLLRPVQRLEPQRRERSHPQGRSEAQEAHSALTRPSARRLSPGFGFQVVTHNRMVLVLGFLIR